MGRGKTIVRFLGRKSPAGKKRVQLGSIVLTRRGSWDCSGGGAYGCHKGCWNTNKTVFSLEKEEGRAISRKNDASEMLIKGNIGKYILVTEKRGRMAASQMIIAGGTSKRTRGGPTAEKNLPTLTLRGVWLTSQKRLKNRTLWRMV